MHDLVWVTYFGCRGVYLISFPSRDSGYAVGLATTFCVVTN